ncbi:MAG TPA: murein biosynthesis integral membrane protein MurJ [Pyrinomonadaceae bacterium]
MNKGKRDEQRADDRLPQPTGSSAADATAKDKTDAPAGGEEANVVASAADLPVGAVEGESIGEQQTARRQQHQSSTGKFAFLVGAGILLSRIVGLIRLRVFAYYFGNSAAKDAFDAAFRIPNFLQNVFGEGALSASFIPVYAGLLARDDEKKATHVASAVLSLLALVTSVLVLAGVLLTPYLIDAIAPGFEGEKRELTIRLVKILFPGAGLLVLSAWCLGVLNSHRRFFLSYTAPVIWNVTIIASLIWAGGRVHELDSARLGPFQFRLAETAAWASVIGSALQFAIQLPTVLRLVKGLRPVLDTAAESVRRVVRNFFPVFFSRGVVQISAYVDSLLASLLPTGAVSALNFTQSLYTLPVSLFGMSVSAAELPAMSSALGSQEEVMAQLRKRLDAGLRQIAFFIVPSAVGFLALGDVMAGVLYQTGEFKRADTLYVWGILAGSALGLLPATLGRLYASTYYALHDTRTPLRYAFVHVVLATVLGYLCAITLPPLIGIDARWGVIGLTASAGIGGWVEFLLLRRSLNRRIGHTGLSFSFLTKLWSGALLGAAVAWGIRLVVGERHPAIIAALVLVPYGLLYFGITYAMKLPEAQQLVGRFTRLLGRRKG